MATTTPSYIHETVTDRYLRGVVGRLGLAHDAQVLNVACEHELVPSFLRGTVDPANVYGVDLDEHVIDGVRIKRCNVDREPLPFGAATFDAVVSIWGLEHFATDRIVREAARVLKPGGVLLIVTPNRVSPLFAAKQVLGARFSRWFYRRVLRSGYHPHPTHYRLNRMRALRRAANGWLDVAQVAYLGPAHALYYLNFSQRLQRLATSLDRRVLSNRLLGWAKPYLVGVLTKPA